MMYGLYWVEMDYSIVFSVLCCVGNFFLVKMVVCCICWIWWEILCVILVKLLSKLSVGLIVLSDMVNLFLVVNGGWIVGVGVGVG